MKKTQVFMATLVSLACLVILTSCKKEEQGNGTQFRATMEDCTDQHGKTTLSGTALNWVSGDRIAIYGTVGCGIYSAIPQAPATTAIFDNVSGETGNAPFRAYYPSTLTTDGVNVTLPAIQTSTDGSLTNFPMYAESSNSELAFKNLCGVLKLHLIKANTNISAISITATNEINGQFTLGHNGDTPVLTYSADGGTTTTLTCTTAQSIASGKDFYIYLPAGNYSGLQIKIVTDDSYYCVKTSNRAINVARSQYTLITLTDADLTFRPIGSVSGLFTINADGDQVWFSQGNLQYQASTDTWRFAENQYDYVGSGNQNVSTTYNGWIDLYMWGTGNNPTLHDNHYSNYSTFVDWGVNAISNGGNQPNTWRTLSSSEWEYILNTRYNAANRYGFGTINGVEGLIILPDTWSLPEGCSFTAGYNTASHVWNTNSYTLSQWMAMETAGAVFLPTTGSCSWGYGMYWEWEYSYSSEYAGYYWSNTPYSNPAAYTLQVSSGICPAQVWGSNKNNSSPVRLVMDKD